MIENISPINSYIRKFNSSFKNKYNNLTIKKFKNKKISGIEAKLLKKCNLFNENNNEKEEDESESFSI